MTRQPPPGATLDFKRFAADSRQRHEELVDLFGQYIIWMRDWTNKSTRQLIESADLRQQLGEIVRQPYEEAAKLSEDDRERAIILAESSVEAFIELFLRLFAHQGMDFALGDSHSVRFRLDMEIVDRVTEVVVHQEIINRNGRKHFADYWGRWLNRFK
ncbi:MAG TPA: hypothetical protein VER03_19695 [Bryobacteraceae bacterium]|nr:hypothetical protein [Bryobacteraceae bacterium]